MNILLVEDDENLAQGLIRGLRKPDWTVTAVTSAEVALEHIAEVDVLITDLRMPGIGGMALLDRARQVRADIEMIVITAFGSIPSAVDAMKRGARAYITKPFDIEELLAHLREVAKSVDLRSIAAGAGRGGLVGSGPAMRKVYADIDAACRSDVPVLITGETGTGKDLSANAVHSLSGRRGGPFVPINLGALPRDMIEGQLFGHEKGAFTGAVSRMAGRFTVASGGTLFLDEIDTLPVELQPKLLRAIEHREIWPLGASGAEKMDVRIIAATNAKIEDLVKDRKFREDLYYRLNVLRIGMPSLREHPEDIPQIAMDLVDRITSRTPGVRVTLTADALAALIAAQWKGNVRELSNVLERAVARELADEEVPASGGREVVLDAAALGPLETVEPCGGFRDARARAANEWAHSTVEAALKKNEGNVSRTARELKMSRTALIRLMRKYNLARVGESMSEESP
jgi:DNA-binding NtrC family response regulator